MSDKPIWILGEALMDCVIQSDGQLRPYLGGSPYNLARAIALLGVPVGYLNPISTDYFGEQLASTLLGDGVKLLQGRSRAPTSLAVVQIANGQPSYAFYREGVADRDYRVEDIVRLLGDAASPGILHTGSLALVPPEHEKIVAILRAAKHQGWIISVDVNLRPRLASDLSAYVRAALDVAALADWLKASDEDLLALGMAAPSLQSVDAIAQQFTAKGAQRIALTFGEHGAYLRVNDKSATQAVAPVRVVDTVGAGDTFWGHCIADWATQEGNAHERVAMTLRNATVAAAINCSRAGCQPPTRAELERALADTECRP